MKNKILIGALALMVSSLAFASGDKFVPAPDYFNGLYAGIGGGVLHTTGNVKNDITDAATFSGSVDYVEYEVPITITVVGTSSMLTKLDSDIGNTTGIGQAFIGFGKTFATDANEPKFYVGIEGFGQYNPVKTNTSASSNGQTINITETFDDHFSPPESVNTVINAGAYDTSVKIKNDYALGGALRFGYLVNPKTMIYILGGVQWAKFDTDINHTATLYTQTDDGSTTFALGQINYTASATESGIGIMPGIGIETMLTKNLSFRAQYAFVYYGKYSFKGDAAAAPYTTNFDTGMTDMQDNPIIVPVNVAAATASDTNVKDLYQGEFTVALTWHFSNIAI